MQLYAVDALGNKIAVSEAVGGVDYLCFECKERVRLRLSPLGRLHFFHLRSDGECRHSGKSEEHIQLQELIQRQIGSRCQQECHLEQQFPEIGRIADVAWPEQHIVFEVQCSPISTKEVRQRCQDYEKIGWYVIWILLSPTFYRKKLKNVPHFLQNRTHYYARAATGAATGEIFDLIHPHFVHDAKGLERRFVVDLGAIQAVDAEDEGQAPFITRRLRAWRFYAKGDLLWHAKEGCFSSGWLELFKSLAVTKNELPLLSFIKGVWYLILETALRSRMR